MGNRHEHVYDLQVGRKTFLLQFSNRGHVAAEQLYESLGGQGDLFAQQMQMGRMSHRVLTALLHGATRKHHADELRSVDDVYEVLDELDEQFEDKSQEEMTEGFVLPLLCAFNRETPERMRKMMRGENPDEANGEDAPKDADKPTRIPKAKSKSSRGKPSSGQESEAV